MGWPTGAVGSSPAWLASLLERPSAGTSPSSPPPGARDGRQPSNRQQPGNRQQRSRARARPRARHQPHPVAVGMPPVHRLGSASATPKRAAATPGDPATAAGLTSSRWALGKSTAARPASTASPAPLTRTRFSITPSPLAARRTGRVTTGADDAPPPAAQTPHRGYPDRSPHRARGRYGIADTAGPDQVTYHFPRPGGPGADRRSAGTETLSATTQ